MEILGLCLTWWLVVACIALLVAHYRYSYTALDKLGIRGPTPWPLIGSFVSLLLGEGFQQTLVKWEKQYGKVFGFYIGSSAVVSVSDLDMVKEIMVKQFSHFPIRKKLRITLKPFTNGLTMIEGQHWKYVRNVLTPAFSGAKMKKMCGVIEGCADTLVANMMKDVNEGKDTEFKRVYGCYSMDCIGSAAFGMQIDSQNNPDDPFVKHAKTAFGISVFRPAILMILISPTLASKFNLSIIPKESMQFFDDILKEALKMRQHDTGEKPIDFLQLMLNAHKEESHTDAWDEDSLRDRDIGYFKDRGLDTEEILANALLFFLAGYETVSSCLGYTSNLLATHPDVQDKLVTEINSVMEEHDDLDYAAIHDMTYLDMVIQESLRIFPPAMKTDRRCQEDCEIKGFKIPKDTQIMIPIWTIHRSPEIWPQPDKFIPERFTKEEKEKRNPYAWLPFGIGPRHCIGMRFALMEIKVALVKMLQKYRFEPCAKTEIPPVPSRFGKMTPSNGFWLKLSLSQ